MKRVIVVMAMLTLVAGLILTPQLAGAKGGGGPKGSVKVMLTPRADNPDGESSGWAVLNTTSEGIVKANVHIEGASPGDTHAVILVVNGIWDEDNTLTIGANGKGVGYDEEDIPAGLYDEDGFPLPPGTVEVRLAVRPEDAGGTTGWTSATVKLPLKVLD